MDIMVAGAIPSVECSEQAVNVALLNDMMKKKRSALVEQLR